MRSVLGWVCICAVVVLPFAGCADGNGGAAGAGRGGAGGAAGAGGGGAGGAAGAGGGGTGGGGVDPAWAFSEGGTSLDRATGVAALSDGTFLMSGMFQETVTFAAGESNETTLASAGVQDIYVGHYEGDGSLLWIKRAGGAAADNPLGLATFADGSFVICGPFQETAIFGPDETNETPLTSTGADDVFIARYNPDGTLAWAKRAGGSEWETCRGIGSLSDGSSVVTGGFRGAATFGLGEANETTLTTTGTVEGATDIFVARYDADGSLIWAKQAGGDALDIGNDVRGSVLDSVIVGGRFEGTATFGKGEFGETELTSLGATDVFLARYNANGTLAWVKPASGPEGDQIWGVTTLADGSSVATGSYLGDVTFGPGEANETTLTNPGMGYNLFVARYEPDGTLVWAKRAGGEETTVGRSIASLADGSSAVTGRFVGTSTFGPGEARETTLTSGSGGVSNAFVARYAASGELDWAARAGGESSASGEGIAFLTDGSIVSTGSFVETATFFFDTPNQTELTSNGDRDCFVSRYPADGM